MSELTPEEFAAVKRLSWENRSIRALLFLRDVQAAVDFVTNEKNDELSRARRMKEIDAAAAAFRGVKNSRPQLRTGLAQVVAAVADQMRKDTSVPLVKLVAFVEWSTAQLLSPERAAKMKRKHIEHAIACWHGKRGRRPKSAERVPSRWEAMCLLYDDVGLSIDEDAAESEWKAASAARAKRRRVIG